MIVKKPSVINPLIIACLAIGTMVERGQPLNGQSREKTPHH